MSSIQKWNGVALCASHQMIALAEESPDDLPTGVVRVGDEVEVLLDAQRIEQEDPLVEKGSFVTIG